MITLPTYLTASEKVRWLSQTEPELADLLQECLDKTLPMEKEIAYLQGREERLEEQLSFARDAFSQIRHDLGNARSAKQAQTAFENVMAESYFEE